MDPVAEDIDVVTLPDTVGHPLIDARSMTSLQNDVDPEAARSLEEFAQCLRRVRVRAGTSYRELEQWGRRESKPLPRSTVQDALAGRHLPRQRLLLTFLEACGVDQQTHPRWIAAWNRLSEPLDATAACTTMPPREHRLPAQLTADVRAAGLRRIGANYLNDLEWNRLFADVQELDIFVAYGQTWRNLHARELLQLAQRPTSRIRVFLPDVDDQMTISVLAARFAITPNELTTRITSTYRDYAKMRRENGAAIEIYYRPGDRLFSFYRLDRTAIVGFYSHGRTRFSAVPVLVCTAPGSLYQFITDELQEIEQQSRITAAQTGPPFA